MNNDYKSQSLGAQYDLGNQPDDEGIKNPGQKWPATQNPQETSRLWKGKQVEGW